MKRIIVALFVAMLLVPSTSAQIPAAALAIDCNESESVVDTGNFSIECTATNPTTYVEKVNIQVNGNGALVSHQSDFVIGAGQDTNFTVNGTYPSFDSYYEMSRFSVSVTGTVTEINSVPPVNVAASTANRAEKWNHHSEVHAVPRKLGTNPFCDV